MSTSDPHASDMPTAMSGASDDRHAETQPEQDSILATQRRLRDRLLIALAAVAGYADAISYVALGQVFTANMTGSTVLLGLNLAQGNGLFALRAGVSIASFLAGVSIGAALVRQHVSGTVWPRYVTRALAVEVGFLALFTVVGVTAGTSDTHGIVYLLIGLAACAMGLQSIAVRSLGVVDITTTYITGTWVGLLAGLTRYLGAEVEAERKRRPPVFSSLHPQARDARMLLTYLVAAAVCGLLVTANMRLALIPLAPALAVAVAIAARGFRSAPLLQRRAD